MTAAHAQLLPQHDVFPESPRAKRYTLIAFAAACLLTAMLLPPVGSDTLALVAASVVLLFWAWRTPQSDPSEAGEAQPGDDSHAAFLFTRVSRWPRWPNS